MLVSEFFIFIFYNRIEKKIAQTNTKIDKMKRDMQNKEDTKTVALGTSKINYLDPRITVAWCKRHEVPIEKVSQIASVFVPLVFLVPRPFYPHFSYHDG